MGVNCFRTPFSYLKINSFFPMRFGIRNGLITAFVAKLLADSSIDNMSPMEVSRDVALSLTKEGNENNNECMICFDTLIETTENGHLDEDKFPHLIMCPHSSLHVLHIGCLMKSFSRKLECVKCRKNCTESIRQALINAGVGSREFKKKLLKTLIDEEKEYAKDFFELLQLFPAEFATLRRDLCRLGKKSATAVATLDEIWHMQLGIPVLSQYLQRYFQTINLSASLPYKFYDGLREYMSNSSPTMAQAKSLIATVYAESKTRTIVQKAFINKAVNVILDALFSRHRMDDNDDDVYDLILLLAENNNLQHIITNFIRHGRFIRSISAEKIIKLLECLKNEESFPHLLFWRIWTMAGAGREFAPEDTQAITNCISDIYAKVGGPDPIDNFMDEITASIKKNERGSVEARDWLANHVDMDDYDGSETQIFAQNGVPGLLETMTEQELTDLFDKSVAADYSGTFLETLYFLAPDAIQSSESTVIMMRQLIQKDEIENTTATFYVSPKGRIGVKDIIDICKLASKERSCNICDYCAELLIANIEKVMQCLEESEDDRAELYEYLKSIDLPWGIALFGNYFQHMDEYKDVISKRIRSIIIRSSRELEFCCIKAPMIFKGSPLFEVLSGNITRLLREVFNNFFADYPFYEANTTYRSNHTRVLVFGSPFFKKYVSANDLDAFCGSLFTELDHRSVQYICIFFNNNYDEEDRVWGIDYEFTMKRHIYVNLHKQIPNIDDLVGGLNKIGFSFTKTADNKWTYAAQNGQEQTHFEPGAVDETIEAKIRVVDKYKLLALLRESLPSQTIASAH